MPDQHWSYQQCHNVCIQVPGFTYGLSWPTNTTWLPWVETCYRSYHSSAQDRACCIKTVKTFISLFLVKDPHFVSVSFHPSSLSEVLQELKGMLWLHTWQWFCVSYVFFIPLTKHENTVNDPNRRDKGLGGAIRAKETSASETEVRNAKLGNWDSV